MIKHYTRVAMAYPMTSPGAPPRVYDTRNGGSIERVTEDGRDDLVVTTKSSRWEMPWSSVAWASDKVQPIVKPRERVRIPGVGRVRRDPALDAPATDHDAAGDGDDELPGYSPVEHAEQAAKPATKNGEWQPPRKPKQRTRRVAA